MRMSEYVCAGERQNADKRENIVTMKRTGQRGGDKKGWREKGGEKVEKTSGIGIGGRSLLSPKAGSRNFLRMTV